MAEYSYKITFFSYWLQADKDGQSMAYDTVALKENGLPIITGRAVKGLLSDASDFLVHLDKAKKDFTKKAYGDTSKEGQLKFGTAYLQETIPKEYQHLLYHQIASVALDENKQAKDKQLRTLEACIPLTLEGIIEDPNDFLNEQNNLKTLEQSAQLVKELGYKRHRGLGRCRIEIIKPDQVSS